MGYLRLDLKGDLKVICDLLLDTGDLCIQECLDPTK